MDTEDTAAAALLRIEKLLTKQNDMLEQVLDSIDPVYDDGQRGKPIASLLATISYEIGQMQQPVQPANGNGKRAPRRPTAQEAAVMPYEDDQSFPPPMCEEHAVEMRVTKKNPAVFYCTHEVRQGVYCDSFARVGVEGVERRWKWRPNR